MRVELPAVLGSAREARRLVQTIEGLAADELEIVQLVVSELVTNSVQHSGLAPGDVLTLTVGRGEGGRWRIEVDDGGSFCGRPGALTRPEGARTGYGLKVVGALSECWEACDGHTVAWVAAAVRSRRQAA